MPSSYKVQKGDTLGTIAKKFYGDAARFPLIVSANHITNPDRLAVGQELLIPDAATAAQGFATPAPPPAPPAGISLPGRTAQLNEERLRQLHPIVATRGRSMIDLAAHAGLGLLVTQGLRTSEEQDVLYAKGRTVPPIGKQFVVTNARGGQSWHNFGLAFDIVVLDALGKNDWDVSHPGWAKAAELGKSVGLEWGGDWKGFKDMPHFQYTGGLTLAECQGLAQSGLPPVWARIR
jgi:LysM repeat protein